jgi:RND family efflux transporter MFP subunit
MRNVRGGAAIRLLACFALSVAVAACSKKQAPPPPRASLTVTAATVQVTAVSRRVDASGTVNPWMDVPVASEVGGLEVTDLLVDEGSRVRQGQVLIKLDDRVLVAQLHEQEAVRDQNDAALARAQQLHGKGFLSQASLDQALAAAKTSRATVAETRARLDQATIRAPVSGTITARSVVKGQVVSVGAQLFRLVRDDQLEMNAQIPEADLPLVRAGMNAMVSSERGVTAMGRVRVVTPQVDPQTRLGLARITLPVGSAFKAGNFATCSIDVGAVPALNVPESSIVYKDGLPGVFLVDGQNKVHYVHVVTGERASGQVEVRSGLTSGARIVTQGGGFLGDGDKVAITAPLTGS